MGRACSEHGEMKNAFKILIRKPEGKRPLGSYRHRLEYNIKMDIRAIEFEGVDWIHLVSDGLF
jgi:hypothetical protein